MHGLINWFARNSVAANLLMVFIVGWGLTTLFTRIPLEVFPSFELARVNVSVPFRGATPSEVEEGVTIKVEEVVQDIVGIKQITSTGSENSGLVSIEVAKGFDTDKVLDEVKQRVDGISTFSEEVGTPVITVPQRVREVISVVVAGPLPEKELRILASRVRDELEALPNVCLLYTSPSPRDS